jgi:hypothetical protein
VIGAARAIPDTLTVLAVLLILAYFAWVLPPRVPHWVQAWKTWPGRLRAAAVAVGERGKQPKFLQAKETPS